MKTDQNYLTEVVLEASKAIQEAVKAIAEDAMPPFMTKKAKGARYGLVERVQEKVY